MEWYDIFKLMKEATTKNTLTQKDLFRVDGEIKSFTNRQKLREFSTTKSALQQMLKELLLAENKREGKEPHKRNPKQLRKL